jgi:hypothetical protein
VSVALLLLVASGSAEKAKAADIVAAFALGGARFACRSNPW